MSYGPQSLRSNVISSTGTDEVNYWNNDARIDSGKDGNFEEQEQDNNGDTYECDMEALEYFINADNGK